MRVELRDAQWHEIQAVLKETYSIWSPGLSKEQYCCYIWRQLQQPWARRSYRFLVYTLPGRIVGSLKLYSMDIWRRGRIYRLAGLGAVYTMEHCRGTGMGKKLMAAALALAKKEGYDGVYLFSDIGAGFYEQFGFKPLGCREFRLSVPNPTACRGDAMPLPPQLACRQAPPDEAPLPLDSRGRHVVLPALDRDYIPFLERYYWRWLTRQPYGVARSADYWKYRLAREAFLHKYSSWNWPGLLLVEAAGAPGGYAVVEQGQKILRVLEVIGDEQTRLMLWDKLLALAACRGLFWIRGWEASLPDHLGKLVLTPRDWGLPLILPFANEFAGLAEADRCCFLELDHL